MAGSSEKGGRRERRIALAARAAGQHGLLTLDDLRSAGCTPAARRWLTCEGELEVVRHRVYRVRASPSTFEQRALAAVIGLEPVVAVAGRSAARLWGLDVPCNGQVEVVSDRRLGLRASPDASYRADAELTRADVGRRNGVPVTSIQWTLADLVRLMHPRDYKLLVDASIARHHVHLKALLQQQSRLSRGRRPGATLLGEVLDVWRDHPEMQSPAESAVLRAIKAARLPAPLTQFALARDDGSQIHLDAAWPDVKVGLEVDGFRFHSDPRTWQDDHERDLDALMAGWRIVRTTARAVLSDPERTCAALLAAGVTKASGQRSRRARSRPEQCGEPVRIRPRKWESAP